MKPSHALQLYKDAIIKIVARNNARNPRVFGSVLHGDDTDNSDLDLLVDPIPGRTTLVGLASIQLEIEALVGIKVDVRTPMALHDRFRNEVLLEARPL